MSVAALNLWGKTVEFVIQKVREIVLKVTAASSDFPSPVPSLSDITTQVDTLESSFEAAVGGGKTLKAQVRTEYKKMMLKMSLLTAYIQNTSGGDATLIRSTGLDVVETAPIGILPAPSNVRTAYGKHPGEIIVRWNGVKKRRSYTVQMNENDPNDEADWQDMDDGDTGKRRMIVEGLTPGKVYWFRVFTLSSVGYSGPSDVTGHRAA